MTDVLLSATLTHLEALVGFDTRNPPREISKDTGLFAYLCMHLQAAGCACECVDLGDGCIYLLARRGDPQLLVNVHVDTVPADPDWSRDPLRLHVDDQRATGLGACDIKGAAAAILAALAVTSGPAALLFSSDEEAGNSRCIRAFLAAHQFANVLVAEPTQCRAVAEHRGIATATATFSGHGGHASAARALHDSAVHAAVRWAARALDMAAASEVATPTTTGGLVGLRLNLGTITGGLKPNMIATSASVRVGLRPPPELPPITALAELASLADDPSRLTFVPGFVAPPLPARMLASPADPKIATESLAHARAAAAALTQALGLEPGPPVDFWTEAALFSDAGATALVFGPGDIAQAHTADEWVALDQLAAAAAVYHRLFAAES